jgi:hypothetical protein|eukprot:COSAG02_NODE_28_length_51367_cov_70.053932_12_plen_36_part_00
MLEVEMFFSMTTGGSSSGGKGPEDESTEEGKKPEK